jgi:hypothetical protein
VAPRPTTRRPAATVDRRAWAHAGYSTATNARRRPTRAAPAVQRIAAGVPEIPGPAIARAAPVASVKPRTTPPTPTTTDSRLSKRRICAVDAPRARSNACSRRRRSDPDPAMANVSSTARMAPGRPRKTKSVSAYRASACTWTHSSVVVGTATRYAHHPGNPPTDLRRFCAGLRVGSKRQGAD